MKLLNLTVIYYLVISIFVLLIGIPLFYIVINKIIIYDIDKTLIERKEKILHNIHFRNNGEPINPAEHDIDEDIILQPTNKASFKDTIYNTDIFIAEEGEMEPFRELSSYVVIKNEPYNLTIQISLVATEYLVSSVVGVQSLLLFMLLTGLILINRSISKRIWTPFYNTINKLKLTELNKNNGFQQEDTYIEEFKDLNIAIQHLVKKNYIIFTTQKQFTENASHEIQTPLALIQSKLDLLIQTPNLSEEQAQLIDYISDSLLRLSKVNRSLLLLSKIDNEQFIETESINTKELIQKLIIQYEDRIHTKYIMLKIEISSTPILIANPTLIEVLFSNLVRNAIQHNIEQGIININIEQSKIVIENSGRPLNTSTEKLFERFQKDNQNAANFGLGLSIVKKICEVYNYKVEYNYAKEFHTIQINF